MAEFQEVMRQWVRVRKATASSTEENVLSVYPLEVYDDAMIKHIEKNVMAWVAEHPEPVYPTWAEYISEQIIHDMCKGEISGPETVLTYAMYKPIPADIAQKLGIAPKGES